MSSLSSGGGGIASCTLLDHFGEAVQLVLAVVAFGSLIIKRKRERPPRPWLVWGLDTSKQVVSSGAAHGVGIITALLLNSQADEVSQCAWYAVAFVTDTSLGVTLSLTFLWVSQRVAARCGNSTLANVGDYRSGGAVAPRGDGVVGGPMLEDDRRRAVEEAHPDSLLVHARLDDARRESLRPSRAEGGGRLAPMGGKTPPARCACCSGRAEVSLSKWGAQMAVWVVCVVLARLCCMGVIVVAEPVLVKVAAVIQSPFADSPHLFLIIVMVACPLLLNVLQLWIQDQRLKRRKKSSARSARLGGDGTDYAPLLGDNDDDDGDDGGFRRTLSGVRINAAASASMFGDDDVEDIPATPPVLSDGFSLPELADSESSLGSSFASSGLGDSSGAGTRAQGGGAGGQGKQGQRGLLLIDPPAPRGAGASSRAEPSAGADLFRVDDSEELN